MGGWQKGIMDGWLNVTKYNWLVVWINKTIDGWSVGWLDRWVGGRKE